MNDEAEIPAKILPDRHYQLRDNYSVRRATINRRGNASNIVRSPGGDIALPASDGSA